ncbi:MAG: hypothetical protein ACLFUS_01920, partial [Candidatus Sumerlaeia bacterium]
SIKRRAGYWIGPSALYSKSTRNPGVKTLAIIGRALGPEDEKVFALLRKRFDSLLQINTAPHLCRTPFSMQNSESPFLTGQKMLAPKILVFHSSFGLAH